MSKETLLSTPLHGVYIPAFLIVFGTFVVKREWMGYSILLALALGFHKFWRGRVRRVLNSKIQYFELSDKAVLNHNTAIYRFRLPRSNDVLGLPVGQHLTVVVEVDGKEHSRSYTPLSSDVDKGYFDLLVKAYPNGVVSKKISELKIGDRIGIRGPKGNWKHQVGLARHFGMIAGGTGITPMLQIIRAVLSNPEDPTQITLLYANVSEKDIILREEIEALAEKDPRFTVHHVLNNPPENWTGAVGYVTEELIKHHFPAPSPDSKVLICGPTPMVNAIRKATVALGYEKARAISKIEDQVYVF
ncbi:cytochrome b5 reductase [Schizosaccharomyces cryophilus OY26]|uniref:NADH-cytochrome b5 reductase n=1 Tax=Schizosaccharomyces cryophilus (strain OY26 / ATCC MYA-4695 / CBS 11777 / NBRC 106824 / NRRL Y48691) TaxID=653667 RepID=S9WZ17_SCHCR|nr:cytochrome b5 reductase [Schizosaccharomyces cryophilus OY26]EPY49942.1 cytochrome b5 reductase [Schizosaccharomyces cryophilus OY26]